MLDAGLVILAGGQGRRLGGCNKALLPLGGRVMVERLLAEVGGLFPQRLLAGPENQAYQALGLEVVPDVYQGCGPLAGIHAGLAASRHNRNLFLACDLPFVSAALAQHLVEAAPGFDALVPRVGGQFEPLFAVYSRACLGPIEATLKQGLRRIVDFYPLVRLGQVEEQELLDFGFPRSVFFNVNTPADLRRAEELAETAAGTGPGGC